MQITRKNAEQVFWLSTKTNNNLHIGRVGHTSCSFFVVSILHKRRKMQSLIFPHLLHHYMVMNLLQFAGHTLYQFYIILHAYTACCIITVWLNLNFEPFEQGILEKGLKGQKSTNEMSELLKIKFSIKIGIRKKQKWAIC